ncbi:hypothetical protein BDW71DRAFT_191560 [Aspergillus fruticulosus]
MKLLALLPLIPSLTSAWLLNFYSDTSCTSLMGSEGDTGNNQCHVISGWTADVLGMSWETEGDAATVHVYEASDCTGQYATWTGSQCAIFDGWAGETMSYMVI